MILDLLLYFLLLNCCVPFWIASSPTQSSHCSRLLMIKLQGILELSRLHNWQAGRISPVTDQHSKTNKQKFSIIYHIPIASSHPKFHGILPTNQNFPGYRQCFTVIVNSIYFKSLTLTGDQVWEGKQVKQYASLSLISEAQTIFWENKIRGIYFI